MSDSRKEGGGLDAGSIPAGTGIRCARRVSGGGGCGQAVPAQRGWHAKKENPAGVRPRGVIRLCRKGNGLVRDSTSAGFGERHHTGLKKLRQYLSFYQASH
jgi:hypothetical protein